MESNLCSKDFAIRRLGTTCRLLKNWEDIAEKYANVKDDDIIDLTDLTIHHDQGHVSRSDAKYFGYSSIRYTRKTLPDQDIHREFGDCLEDEFPCGLGEEDNDHFEAKSLAGVSMVSNKTVIEVMVEKMNLLKLHPGVKHEETSDAETLSSSDSDEELEITNPKSLLSKKHVADRKGSSNAYKRNGKRQSSIDRTLKNRMSNRQTTHNGVLKGQQNSLTLRRVSSSSRWKSLQRYQEESEEWESESSSSEASGECSKAEMDAMFHGTPSKKGRRDDCSKYQSSQQEQEQRKGRHSNTSDNAQRRGTPIRCHKKATEFDSMNVLPPSEASDLTVDSGVVRDYHYKPIMNNKTDDDVVIVESNYVSSSSDEEAILLSCDEDSVDMNYNSIKTPDKNLDSTYTIISSDYNQHAIKTAANKSTQRQTSTNGNRQQINMNKTPVGNQNDRHRKPRRIQPTLIAEDSSHPTVNNATNWPGKIKTERPSPMKISDGLTARDYNTKTAKFRSYGQPVSEDLKGQLQSSHYKNTRHVSYEGDILEIRPIDEDRISEDYGVSCSPLKYSLKGRDGWQRSAPEHHSRAERRDLMQDYYPTRSHNNPERFHHEVQMENAENFNDQHFDEKVWRSPEHDNHVINGVEHQVNWDGRLYDRRVLQPNSSHQYARGESDCFQYRQRESHGINRDVGHQGQVFMPKVTCYNGGTVRTDDRGFNQRCKVTSPQERRMSRSNMCSRTHRLDDVDHESHRQQLMIQSQPPRLKQSMLYVSDSPFPPKYPQDRQRHYRPRENLHELQDETYVEQREIFSPNNPRYTSNQQRQSTKITTNRLLSATNSLPAKRKRSMDSACEESFSDDDNMSGVLEENGVLSSPHFVERISPLDYTESQIETVMAQNVNISPGDLNDAYYNERHHSDYENIQPSKPSPRTWNNNKHVGHRQQFDQRFERDSYSEARIQKSTERHEFNRQSPRNQGLIDRRSDGGQCRVSDVGPVRQSDRVLSCTTSSPRYGHRQTKASENQIHHAAGSPRVYEQQEFVFDDGQLTPTSRRLQVRNVSKSPRLAENSSPSSFQRQRKSSPRTPTSVLRALSLNDVRSSGLQHSGEMTGDAREQRGTSPRDSQKTRKQESPRPKPVLKFLRRQFKESPLCSPSPDKSSPKMLGALDDLQRRSSASLSADRVRSAEGQKGHGSLAPRSLTPRQSRITSSRSLDFRGHVISTPVKTVGNTPSLEIDLSTIREGTTIHSKDSTSTEQGSSTQFSSPTVVLRTDVHSRNSRHPPMTTSAKTRLTPQRFANEHGSNQVTDKVNAWLKEVNYTTDLGPSAEISQVSNSSYNYPMQREAVSFRKTSKQPDISGTSSLDLDRSENSVSDDSDLVVM